MKTSEAGLAALAQREGGRLKAYRDVRGIWTIGIGHTAAAGPPKPQSGMTLTQESMMALFAVDIVQYENAVNAAVKVPLTQHQFDACVSLCYNIGVNGFMGSTVVHMLNTNNIASAANAFRMWETPAVLKARREAERAQFLTKD
jgi:lysozyme